MSDPTEMPTVPGERLIALFADDDGFHAQYPMRDGATVADIPKTILTVSGRVLTLRMIHHVPSAAELATIDAAQARVREWQSRRAS